MSLFDEDLFLKGLEQRKTQRHRCIVRPLPRL